MSDLVERTSAASSKPPGSRRSGRVSAFDEVVGLGTVVSGPETYPFHCTQIAGGSRAIAPGTAVSFDVVAGHRGSWEAADLRPYPDPDSPVGPP